jgi:hypothetical protein
MTLPPAAPTAPPLSGQSRHLARWVTIGPCGTPTGTFSHPMAVANHCGQLMEQCRSTAGFRSFPSTTHARHFRWSSSFGTKRPWVQIPPPRLLGRDDRTTPDLHERSGTALLHCLITALSGPIRQRRGSIRGLLSNGTNLVPFGATPVARAARERSGRCPWRWSSDSTSKW